MGQKWGKMGQKQGRFPIQFETPKSPETLYFQGFEAFFIHTSHMLLVPAVGLEPTRSCPRKILSLVRLPIPPHRLVDTMAMRHQRIIVYINMIRLSISFFIFLNKSLDDIEAVKSCEIILRGLCTTNQLVRTILLQKHLSRL